MEIRFLGHACFELSDGSDTVLIDPFLSGNPKAAIAAEDAQATTILLTHGHADHLGDTVSIAKRTGAPVVAIVELAAEIEAGRRRDLRPESRGHGQVRLGLGQARSRLAHLDHAEGHREHARRPGRQLQGHDRLPPRRHVPVLRSAAGGQARADRRRADVHRRPLHDGPDRRGRGRRARRGEDRDPLPLQHLPADRGRRAGVQVRRRVRHAARTWSCSSPARPTRLRALGPWYTRSS